jgi:hypothetical protein
MEPPVLAVKKELHMSKYDDIKVTLLPLPEGAELEGTSIVQFDEQGKFVEAHSFGNFVGKIEGGMRLIRPDGSTFTLKEGNITAENFFQNRWVSRVCPRSNPLYYEPWIKCGSTVSISSTEGISKRLIHNTAS